MRLICPNCGAQYEVPEDVIPDTGRDVQCSNCGDTWFQPHPDHDVELAEELERALPDQDWQPDEPEIVPEPEPEPAPQRRELDPSVTDVLRQEAEHEARAREAEASTLESQPDLGLQEPESDATRRAREARERMARLRGESPEQDTTPAPETDPGEEAAAAAAAASRGDILPDIDDINATLRSTGDRRAEAKVKKTISPVRSSAYRRGRGFRTGFGLTLLLAALAIITYVNADRIVALVPQAKPVMTVYVEKVNEARYWLDTQMVDVMIWLDEKAAAVGGKPSGFDSPAADDSATN